MTGAVGRAWFAILAYAGLALLPLGLAAIGAPSSRGFWIEFGVGLGFVGLAMFGLQFALTARFRHIAGYLGQDTMLQFHRQAALVAFMLVLAHPLILLAVHPPFMEFLDPRANLPRALALIAVMVFLVAIIVTTIWRTTLRIPYEWWRLGHGIMGLFILVIGLTHVLRVNHYVSVPWKQAFWAGMTGAALLLLVQMRVLKPLRMLRRPYRVTDVKREGGPAARTWTVTIEPVGHAAMRFRPGQFAWLSLGVSPFTLQQHPFSFVSSSEDRNRIQFTIKELGDYTTRIGGVQKGTGAFIEGPYGAFTFDEDAPGGVFIVGGIGITPIMSILRTLRDRGDQRPLLLIYTNISQDHVVFKDELTRLEQALELRIVHVLEEPPAEWAGEVGRLTPEMLDRHLPSPDSRRQYLICGPEPLMDLAERHLLERKVLLGRIRSERFNIA